MARVLSSISMSWGHGVPHIINLTSSFHAGRIAQRQALIPWQPAAAKNVNNSIRWRLADEINKPVLVAYDETLKVDNFAILNWAHSVPIDKFNHNKWAKAVATDNGAYTGYGSGFAQDAATVYNWAYANAGNQKSEVVKDLYRPPSASNIVFNLSELYRPPGAGTVLYGVVKKQNEQGGEAYSPPSALTVAFDLEGEYQPPGGNAVLFDLAIFSGTGNFQSNKNTDQSVAINWLSPPALDHSSVKPWGTGITLNNPMPPIDWTIEPGDPLKPEPEPLPIKGSYYLMNSINLVTVQDRTPLALADFSVSMDLDSHSHTLSISLLNQASFNSVVPMTGPVDVELSINGHKMIFMIESGGQSGALERKSWKASGASKTKQLAAPYAPKRSKSSTFLTDAAGLAAAEVAGTGLVLNWPQGLERDAVNWQMPGGVFSYEGLTPIDVIKKLAATVGAVVVPHLDGTGLTVQPRWPVLPWQLQSTSPDVLIHESMATNYSADYVPAAGFDELWVSGESHGYQSRIYRATTGGTITGPQVVDRWLTTPAANIQRGAQELAEAAQMLLVSVSVIVLEQAGPGIIRPGDILEMQYTDTSQNWRALVLSNDIGAGANAVDLFQNLKLARPI